MWNTIFNFYTQLVLLPSNLFIINIWTLVNSNIFFLKLTKYMHIYITLYNFLKNKFLKIYYNDLSLFYFIKVFIKISLLLIICM